MTTETTMDHEQIDIPIESQEQAQLLEQKFRDQAIARVLQNYVTLDGISHPDDVTEDGECEECGADVPKARIKALMTEFRVGDTAIWKANPNARVCVECASKNEKVKKQFWNGISTQTEL